MFMSLKGVSPGSSSLSDILDFILSLKNSGLGHSLLRVYLAAISAYHP